VFDVLSEGGRTLCTSTRARLGEFWELRVQFRVSNAVDVQVPGIVTGSEGALLRT